MEIVTISDLEQAINRARQSVPATGRESALSADVSLLADLYGELIFRGHKAFRVDSVSIDHQDVLKRWIQASQQHAA